MFDISSSARIQCVAFFMHYRLSVSVVLTAVTRRERRGDHAHIIAMILLLVYLYSLLVLSVSAHQSRSYNPLSISQLKRVIQLGPPQFSSVTDGHLGKLLIPRPCMSFGTFLDFPSFKANIKISWIGKQVSCCTTN